MKIGFICPDVPGHINPMTALARHVVARNNEVVFLYSSGARGLPYIPYDDDEFQTAINEVSKRQGEDALQFALQHVMTRTETIMKSLPKIVQDNKIEALVIDNISFYAELAAIQLGIPYVHACGAMHLDFSGQVPLATDPWPPEKTAVAFARNREGVNRWVQMVQNCNAGVRARAETAGLTVNWDDPSATYSPLALITQVPKAFDFESSHWPSHHHHTGPFHDGKGRDTTDFPWERLTGAPLVYASMGTILNGRVDVFRTIVAALAKNPNVQLVLSVGDRTNPKDLGPVPKNAIVMQRTPQLEVLKRTSVCITHCGLNTVLESLTQGVPQVAIPVTFDQPGVAARIAYHKTGAVTSLDKLTPEHLSDLLKEVLEDPSYRNNARRMQMAISEANGLSVAADLVDRTLRAA
ncbi:MAG: glycosyltransferase family 1 protein [Verrucomicrobia bacterium]|nr:glycosyltransferase family 1 protein [Verrucomicrobiota bacterium]